MKETFSCVYCNALPMKLIKTQREENNVSLGIEYSASDTAFLFVEFGGDIALTEISYCPKCGRKLRGQE